MSEGRTEILGALRRALQRSAEDGGAEQAEARLAGHARNLVPARAALPRAGMLRLFEDQAKALSASVAHVAGAAQVPAAVAAFLKSENLPAELRLAPDPELGALPWQDQPLLQVSEGPARESDPVSVTGALAGIAETGTLMLRSGPEGPTTLNFLPENHIVVLPAARVLAAYEDGWDLIRERFGAGTMPRTVNFITGPSRTADIEQTIQLGAHGPRRLHIILIDGEIDRGTGDTTG